MRTAHRKIGCEGEKFVAEYLTKNGYRIIKTGYKKGIGEIDVIAVKGEMIAFVEVKTRKLGSSSNGYDRIDYDKIRRIISTAQVFMTTMNASLQPRFDVAIVFTVSGKPEGIDYIESAFDATCYNI